MIFPWIVRRCFAGRRHALIGQAFRSGGSIGKLRIRFPVAAKIALHRAGMAAGSGGSPSPVGELSVVRKWTSIGTAERLSSRFARVRVRAARRDFKRSESRPEEWLLIEWPKGEQEPTKYWLSTLPEDITLHRLVYFTKLRWRIERDYQELKQEVGLGHFEGRGWRGFHHHATLCIAAYGFLISERGISQKIREPFTVAQTARLLPSHRISFSN
jgi:hypothetical protein